ncbi:unnamed protein product [Protopolystoma xenopodis]|uniref:Uncharacterized protein n=1 Tax=Protopolystoma xenopodis TaxID=117903 RepID=A0A3S5CM77_9PLAT|nr:unnamed protein product [Protopolystoma xenopodis]
MRMDKEVLIEWLAHKLTLARSCDDELRRHLLLSGQIIFDPLHFPTDIRHGDVHAGHHRYCAPSAAAGRVSGGERRVAAEQDSRLPRRGVVDEEAERSLWCFAGEPIQQFISTFTDH